MVKRVLFVTGTDTDVGKTVVTCLLTRHFLARDLPLAALKPFCSGGRNDAEALFALQRGRLTLDEINPWFFPAPLSPMIAAKLTGRAIQKVQVLEKVRRVQKKFPMIIIEGAGGLLSPLGRNFDSLDLITELKAFPIVVCRNRLGAINQARLAMRALPRFSSETAQLVLVQERKPDASQSSNAAVLRDYFSSERVHELPWTRWKSMDIEPTVRRMLTRLANNILN